MENRGWAGGQTERMHWLNPAVEYHGGNTWERGMFSTCINPKTSNKKDSGAVKTQGIHTDTQHCETPSLLRRRRLRSVAG